MEGVHGTHLEFTVQLIIPCLYQTAGFGIQEMMVVHLTEIFLIEGCNHDLFPSIVAFDDSTIW